MFLYLFLWSPACPAVVAREVPCVSSVPGEQGPSYSESGWSFSVTPRVAYRIFASQGGTVTPEASNFQTVTVDLGSDLEFGATFTVARPRSRGELVFTILSMPTSTGAFETILLSPVPFLAIGEASSSRLDVEAMYRRPIRDTDAYWMAGFEYVGMGIERTSDEPFFEVLESDTRTRSYLAKGGVGGSLELSRSGRHRLATDLLVAFGYRRENTEFTNLQLTQTDDDGTFGFDIGAGYAFRIRPSMTLNARYRVQGGWISQRASLTGTADSDLQLLTGFEFSVTVPF